MSGHSREWSMSARRWISRGELRGALGQMGDDAHGAPCVGVGVQCGEQAGQGAFVVEPGQCHGGLLVGTAHDMVRARPRIGPVRGDVGGEGFSGRFGEGGQ
ncbi:hypothetical protein ACFQ60_00730 [Streptomyces zhihengii]